MHEWIILTQIFPFYQWTHTLLHYSSISSNREVSESAAVRSGGGKENRARIFCVRLGYIPKMLSTLVQSPGHYAFRVSPPDRQPGVPALPRQGPENIHLPWPPELWNQFLGWAEYAQNSLRQSSTGLTPFQCVLGFQPPLFPWSGEPSDVPAVDYWFREREGVWDATHHQLQQAVRRQRIAADVRWSASPEYQPGQKVWLSTRDIKLRLPCRKLSPRFVGPFTILEQINPVTYKLQLPPHYRIHPTFHVSLLKPFSFCFPRAWPDRRAPSPSPPGRRSHLPC